MRIAIPSTGDSLDSTLDSRFGRASRILIVDTENDRLEIVDNSAGVGAAQGAGIQTAERIAGLDVDSLVTAHCGPKAFRVLSKAGISVYSTTALTVAEAVDLMKQGNLTAMDAANAESHW